MEFIVRRLRNGYGHLDGCGHLLFLRSTLFHEVRHKQGLNLSIRARDDSTRIPRRTESRSLWARRQLRPRLGPFEDGLLLGFNAKRHKSVPPFVVPPQTITGIVGVV